MKFKYEKLEFEIQSWIIGYPLLLVILIKIVLGSSAMSGPTLKPIAAAQAAPNPIPKPVVVPMVPPKPVEANPNTFAIGDTKDKVVRIMGSPQRTYSYTYEDEESSWYYYPPLKDGESAPSPSQCDWVEFKYNIVSNYGNNLGSLKITGAHSLKNGK